MQTPEGWERLSRQKGMTRYIVSSGSETMQMTLSGDKNVFEFLNTGKKITCTLPLPELVGEAAWDATRIWVPVSSGANAI